MAGVKSPQRTQSPNANPEIPLHPIEKDAADDTSSSSGDSPAPSSNSSAEEITIMDSTETTRGKTLQERSRIPLSLYVSLGTIFGFQCSSGMWKFETIQGWIDSFNQAATKSYELMNYLRYICNSLYVGSSGQLQTSDYVQAAIVFVAVFAISYVFLIAPFMAGLWTGPRARRHKLHRYMGLAFLVQYSLAWVEFLTNYEAARSSYMPHLIALNGLLQSYSAFFSFKVLPELSDAGYYSDKAVMSRSFIHENAFFSLFVVFGSVYYNENLRVTLRTNLLGRFLEYTFIFFPYILIRPCFPITRFKNAGTTRNGRSEKNKRYYEITTIMVKIFFLWAKYFLGFFMNFMIFLDLVTEEQWHVIHGMYLLNLGTVSLAIFLHTLRFRKVLPPTFTFSVYILQIWATFTALPLVLNMFISHPKLCAVATSGLLCNMTRNRKIHGVWCVISMILLTRTNIEW